MERSKPAAKKRFFVRGGKPRPVPSGPFSLLFTRLFSLFGKLRLLMEPFVGRSDPESEPSVQEFAERRLGKDVSDYAINPFMAGVYGGDPKRLSIKYAFAPFWNLEQKYGSIILGAIKSMKEKKASGDVFRPVMVSFKGGMGTLIKKLAGDLGDGLKTSARVISVDSTADGRWEVSWGTDGEDCCDTYDALAIAVPAPDIASLPLGGALSAALAPLSKSSTRPWQPIQWASSARTSPTGSTVSARSFPRAKIFRYSARCSFRAYLRDARRRGLRRSRIMWAECAVRNSRRCRRTKCER